MCLPNISLPAVALPADHLRAHPVGGAGHGADPGAGHADGLQPLAGTEVPKFHVSRGVPEDVGPWGPEFSTDQLRLRGRADKRPSPTFDVPVDDHVAV